MPFSPKPATCGGCVLEKTGQGFAQVEGTGANGVLIVGEALGEREAADSLPFRPNAESGSLLERCLRRAGLSRESFAITNTINCRPPRNYLEGSPWEYEAISHCKVHRDANVRRFRPRVLLALGGVATRTLTGLAGPKQGVGLLRGFILSAPDYNLPVVASYHPSFINRGAKALTGVLIRDIELAVKVAREGVPIGKDPHYVLNPTPQEAWYWYYSLWGDGPSDCGIAYDIETEYSHHEVDESELTPENQRITQIQFSIGKGTAIVMPWAGEYIDVVRAILRLPNPKWSWNGRLFDDPILEAHGMTINGERHDLILAWHHLQPDLPRALQYATSFYCPEFGPWKHISGANLAIYGAKDADATYRCGEGLFADLRQRGLYDAYRRHVYQLTPILDAVTRRGLAVDARAQSELKTELEGEIATLHVDIQPYVPEEVKGRHPAEGFKALSAEKKKWVERLEAGEAVRVETAQYEGYFVKRKFGSNGNGGDEVERYCVVKDFNVSSSQQVLRYLKHRRYPVPRTFKENRETTGEMELRRLYAKTKDPVLERALLIRKRAKLISSFCSRDWVPGADGRVHPLFLHGVTGTGQLSVRRPNSTQFPQHGPLAKKAGAMLIAAPGRKLVKLDWKSFHARTLALEARDLKYDRLSRMDVHSFVTAHFLHALLMDAKAGRSLINPDSYRQFATEDDIALMRQSEDELRERLQDLDHWLNFSDVDLSERLAWVKKRYKPIRDFKAKRAILGIGFGMGINKLYDMNKESFASLKEAKIVSDILHNLFPEVFAWQDAVRREAHNQGYLTTKHGHLRYFWEVFKYDSRRGAWVAGESSEEAIAFKPANDAHGHFRDCLLWAEEEEILEKYRLVNLIHDCWVFEPLASEVDECIEQVAEVMQRRSKVLVDEVAAPLGFSCAVDAAVGRAWSQMAEVQVGAIAV